MPKKIARKKKIARISDNKKLKKTYPIESLPDLPPEETLPDLTDTHPSGKKYRTPVLVLLLAAAIGLTLLIKNGLVVSAVVNGSPVYSWQLYSRLMSRFGAQTLEGMITEKLIADASRTAGVSVSQADIEARQNEMLKNVGDEVTLEDLLKYQGMTKDDFQGQLKLQLSVERILKKDITIGEEEISLYISSYSARMEATTEADLREEAKKAIFDQKISEKVNGWFEELKNTARIMRFL